MQASNGADAESPIVGMFHGGVSVSDLDRSMQFYVDVLGLQVLAQRDATDDYLREMHSLPFSVVRMAFLAVPNSTTVVELLEYQGVDRHRPTYAPPDPATGHLCFLVADIQAIDARLRAAGVRARSEAPVEITAGPNKGSWAVYFEDPDGFPIEFIQRQGRG
ncbi:MAG TPA: VOC family protein [Candidatus Limnocylindrales bacterium]|nr:VOC family protein [Candidatus Limnocylindrales bacterium]